MPKDTDNTETELSLQEIFKPLGFGRRRSDPFDIRDVTDEQIETFSSSLNKKDPKRIERTYVALFKKLRETQRQAHQAFKKASHQSLSSLPNKESFGNVLTAMTERATQKKQNFAVLMLDIDQFKKFNDTYGHHIGDQVIQMVANKLKEISRQESDFVSHWGGDEFALIIGDVNREDAEIVIQKIKSTFPITIEIGGQNIPINVSVGGVPTDGIKNYWENLPDNEKKPTQDEINFVVGFFEDSRLQKEDIEEASRIVFKMSDAYMYQVKESRNPVPVNTATKQIKKVLG